MKTFEQITEELGGNNAFVFAFTTTQLHLANIMSEMCDSDTQEEADELIKYASKIMSTQAGMIAKHLKISMEDMELAMETASSYIRNAYESDEESKH